MPTTDLNAALPSSVVVAYPTTGSGAPASGLYAVTVTLTGLALAEFGTATGNNGAKVFHSSAVATYTGGGTPTNAAALLALATQIATDYYRHQAARAEVCLNGAQPWQPEGLTDVVEWEQADGAIFTRGRRGPWLDQVEELQHGDPRGAIITSVCPMLASARAVWDGGLQVIEVGNSLGQLINWTVSLGAPERSYDTTCDKFFNGCGLIWTVDHPERLTVPWNGLWRITANVAIEGDTTARQFRMDIERSDGFSTVTLATVYTDSTLENLFYSVSASVEDWFQVTPDRADWAQVRITPVSGGLTGTCQVQRPANFSATMIGSTDDAGNMNFVSGPTGLRVLASDGTCEDNPTDCCPGMDGSGSGSDSGSGRGGNCCAGNCGAAGVPATLTATVTSPVGCYTGLPGTFTLGCLNSGVDHFWSTAAALTYCGHSATMALFCDPALGPYIQILFSGSATPRNVYAQPAWTCSPFSAVFLVDDHLGDTCTVTVTG